MEYKRLEGKNLDLNDRIMILESKINGKDKKIYYL